jgi:hypothetical protein
VTSGADDPAFGALRTPVLTVKALGIVTVNLLAVVAEMSGRLCRFLIFPEHMVVVFFEN